MSNGVQFLSDRGAFVAANPGIDIPGGILFPVPSLAWTTVCGEFTPIDAVDELTIAATAGSSFSAFQCTVSAIAASGCDVAVHVAAADGTGVDRTLTLPPGKPQFFGIQAGLSPIVSLSFHAPGRSGQLLYGVSEIGTMLANPSTRLFSDSQAFHRAVDFPGDAGVPGKEWNLSASFRTDNSFSGPISVSGPLTCAPAGYLLGFGCRLTAASSAATTVDVVVTTADGATQSGTVDLPDDKPRFLGIVAGTSAITGVSLTPSTVDGHPRFIITAVETSSTDAGVNATLLSADAMAKLFPSTTRVDFSGADLGIDQWAAVPPPLDAQTNNDYFKPGMIVPNVSFGSREANGFRYFNIPKYLSFVAGKGVAGAAAHVTLTIDVSRAPAKAAALNLLELGGYAANYRLTVNGTTGGSATFSMPAGALSQTFIGIVALRAPIASITIRRRDGDLGAYGMNQFEWAT